MKYYTGDLHFGHDNVIKFDNRPFSNVTDMNLQLIKNINSRVKKDDELEIVGDLSFKIGVEELKNLLLKIHCKNITLIKGNHDDLVTKNPEMFKDIFKEIHEMKIVKQDKNYITSCHYPLLSWRGMKNGGVNLYAHVHTNDESINDLSKKRWNAYNVGMPVNDLIPITLQELMSKFGYDKYYYRKLGMEKQGEDEM